MKIVKLLLSLVAISMPAYTAEIPACESREEFHQLDFWLGEWDVYAGETKVGENSIRKILNGWAIEERWTSVQGGEGRSLFWFHPGERVWKQVWVTGRALAPGGVKEKTLVETLPDGSLRFQGKAFTTDGEFPDRTTLAPLRDGSVRQLIEYSTDGGKTWNAAFDAVYRLKAGAEPHSAG